MQSQTQRRRHGEPVVRLSLSIRCGRRHTRRREVELVSITCSTLQIRRRWVHVPRSILPLAEGMESVGGRPMSDVSVPRRGRGILFILRANERQLAYREKREALLSPADPRTPEPARGEDSRAIDP